MQKSDLQIFRTKCGFLLSDLSCLLLLFIIFPAKFGGRHNAEEKANTILLFLIHKLSFPLEEEELRKHVSFWSYYEPAMLIKKF